MSARSSASSSRRPKSTICSSTASPARPPRRAGHGRTLLELADQDARELGLPEIRLCTNEAMTENLAFYPRQGFHETGRGVQDGYHRAFFAKVL